MAAGVKSLSKTFVWIILGLLIIGLAGFGATSMSGTIRTIGHAGSQSISVDAYARELQREMRGIQAQTGEPLPMSQVQSMGLDQIVLSRLVSLASLDNEVAELGLSIGDENLQREIIGIPAFQGIDGSFDPESYRFALSQAGIGETEFEADLRAESARTLVQGAIVSGVRMPDAMIDTMTQYVAARRSFTWARMQASDLDAPIPAPTDAQLQAHYDANADLFTLPETKSIQYVLLTPEMILDQVEVSEDALRTRFQERQAEFNLPERRLVERLVFADEQAASGAMAQLEVSGTTYETLVQNRGLTLSDIDLGDVTSADLGAASEAVFAAEIGDVVGPLPSDLGPALYRINGVLSARVTTFEDAVPQLRDELAADRARRLIETQAQDIDDLLAGGASFDELAQETDLTTGQIDWTEDTDAGIAAYPEFRQLAGSATLDDFPAVEFLEDGGIFALQVDDILPPRPEPFEQARDAVAEAWRLVETETALAAQAQTIVSDLAVSGDFADTGLSHRIENGLTRSAFLEGTPPEFMEQVFEMEPGELRVVTGSGTVLIVRLDDELPPEETGELAAMRDAFSSQMDQALATALFEAYVRDARLRAQPQIDQRALNAVLASFQ